MQVNGTNLPTDVVEIIATALPRETYLRFRTSCRSLDRFLSLHQLAKEAYVHRFGLCPHLSQEKRSFNWIKLFASRIERLQATPLYKLERRDNCRILPACTSSGRPYFKTIKSTLKPISAEIAVAFADRLLPSVKSAMLIPFNPATCSYTPPCSQFPSTCPTITTKFFYVDRDGQLKMDQYVGSDKQTQQISDNKEDRCYQNEPIVGFMDKGLCYVTAVCGKSLCVWQSEKPHSSPLWQLPLSHTVAIRHFSYKGDSFLLLELKDNLPASRTLVCWQTREQLPRWKETFSEQNQNLKCAGVISSSDHPQVLFQTKASLFTVNALTGAVSQRINFKGDLISKSVGTTWKEAGRVYLITEGNRLAAWSPGNLEKATIPAKPNSKTLDISVTKGRYHQLWVLSRLTTQAETETHTGIYSLILGNYNPNLECQKQWLLQDNVVAFHGFKLDTFKVLDETLVQAVIFGLTFRKDTEEDYVEVATYTLTPKERENV